MPRPMGPEGEWHSSPRSQRRELPLDVLFNGQGNRVCFYIFSILHNDYVLLL